MVDLSEEITFIGFESRYFRPCKTNANDLTQQPLTCSWYTIISLQYSKCPPAFHNVSQRYYIWSYSAKYLVDTRCILCGVYKGKPVKPIMKESLNNINPSLFNAMFRGKVHQIILVIQILYFNQCLMIFTYGLTCVYMLSCCALFVAYINLICILI